MIKAEKPGKKNGESRQSAKPSAGSQKMQSIGGKLRDEPDPFTGGGVARERQSHNESRGEDQRKSGQIIRARSVFSENQSGQNDDKTDANEPDDAISSSEQNSADVFRQQCLGKRHAGHSGDLQPETEQTR